MTVMNHSIDTGVFAYGIIISYHTLIVRFNIEERRRK